MDVDKDRAGRRTRAFWHRFPQDYAWRQVTFAQKESQDFKLEACCRNCFHHGPV